nr:hypothetical protein BaRGS_020891 [Batillaria attramentaria]
MCKISAAVLHYLFLTFHCWALAYSVTSHDEVVSRAAWVAVEAALYSRRHRLGGSDRRCRFNGCRRRTSYDGDRLHLVMTVFSLLPVSSVPWLLGLSSPTAVVMQYLFVILNSAQGLFIFLLHMLLSTQIRSLLRNRMNEGEPRQGEEIKMSKSGSTGPSHDITESSIVNVGCGMKNITSRRG